MVGDSAVTRLTGKGKIVTDDACKVQYAKLLTSALLCEVNLHENLSNLGAPFHEDSLWLIVT
jgi:hypothetical protein